jgi:cell division protein FtsZ
VERIERSISQPQLRSPALPAPADHPEELPARPVSEPARHAAPYGLDPYGRLRHSVEPAALDIPAFLGRGAN